MASIRLRKEPRDTEEESCRVAHLSTTDTPKLTRAELAGTLTGMLLTLMLAALDQTIVGTAMPRIISQLHGFERYGWVTASYLVGSTLAVAVFGRLSDLYGRKRLFIGGVLLFIGASALCGAAGELPVPSFDGMDQLIAFRALQGIGGGIITALIFTIIGDIFSPSERGKYQGLFAALIGVASIIGPTLGGWITDHLSWRWTFYVNLPIGLIAVVTLIQQFPDIRPAIPGTRRVDWWGVALLAAWLVPLLIALTMAGQYGWSSPSISLALAFSAICFAGFVIVESRAQEPLLPPSLFRNRVILLASIQMFLIAASLFSVIIYLPLFVQAVLGASATDSGSLLTPMMLAGVVMSIASGQIVSRTARYRELGLVGAALMLVGIAMLAAMESHTTMTVVLRNSIIVGFGFGLLQPLYTLAVQHVAPRAMMGAATTAAQFSRSIGATIGVAVFGSLLLLVYQAQLGPKAAQQFHNPLLFRDTSAYGTIPEEVREALAHALRVVFGTAAGLMALGFFLNLLVPAAIVEPQAGSNAGEPVEAGRR